MIDDPHKPVSRDPAALGSDLDAYESRRAPSRRWGLGALAAAVALGFVLQALMPFRARHAPPPVSLMSPQTPALEVDAPPGGSNRLLSIAQIRWCLREDIRIDVFQRSAHGATPRFNATVADYNRRCTHFRYRDNELERARRDVDDARASIVEEAMAEAYAAAGPAAAGQLAAATYSVLTKDVQGLLRALGYTPGAVDGFFGAKTKAAVEAFEADQGRRPSGAITEALRRELLERARSAGIAEARLFEATAAERQAVRESCAAAAGVAGYNRCVESALRRLAGQRPARALPVTESERAVIDQACARAKLHDGDSGHARCVEEQLADLAQLEDKPSLPSLTEDERAVIQFACDSIGAFYGPAAFYRCAQERLAELSAADARTHVATADSAQSTERR